MHPADSRQQELDEGMTAAAVTRGKGLANFLPAHLKGVLDGLERAKQAGLRQQQQLAEAEAKRKQEQAKALEVQQRLAAAEAEAKRNEEEARKRQEVLRRQLEAENLADLHAGSSLSRRPAYREGNSGRYKD